MSPTPTIRAGRLERRDASAGLSKAVAAVGSAENGTVWLAWTAPSQRKPQERWRDRSWYRVNRCVLDDDGNFRDSGGIDDGAEQIVIFVRLVSRSIDRVALIDSRCSVDAGTKTVYFLDPVASAESVTLLAGLVRQEAGDKAGRDDEDHSDGHGRRNALVAIALTDDPTADRALEEFVAASNPRWLRRDAAFWLGASRGRRGHR
jgi:hypothetical protein